MNKTTKIIIGIIIVGLGVWVIKAGNQPAKSQTIKIGVVAPLTGGAAGFGQALVKGLELAKNDLKDVKNDYVLIFEDDGTNPATSASAAQKLVNVDKVDAIITTTSGTGNAVKPIATAANIVHICVCVDTRIVDNKTNFTYLVLPEVESKAWVAEAAKSGPKTIAIIAQKHPGFVPIKAALYKELEAAGIKIVFDEEFDPSIRDFKTILAKAAATKPDIYYAGAFSPSLDILGKELNNQGIKNYAGIGTISIAPDLKVFEGVWFTDTYLSDVAYKERFEQTYPDIRFNVRTAPESYDVFNILVDAFESGQGVGDHISKLTSYDGKVGKVTKPADSGAFDIPVAIWTIKDGQAVQIK